MSGGADKGQHHGEIIIVRRGGDHEEGHHGGAWKIAFADFMTAMMCFFLVMWLINAANEQTKASVASYFNPVKLVDRNTNKKGLEDISDAQTVSGDTDNTTSKKADDAATDSSAESKAEQDEPDRSDASFFADPYAVLAEISAEEGTKQNLSDKGDGGAADAGPSDGASGGDAYRDPFAPDFWTSQVAEVPEAEASAERPEAPEGAPDTQAATAAPALAGPAAALPERAAPPEPKPGPVQSSEAESDPAQPAPDKAASLPPPAAEQAAQEIREELEKSFQPGDKAARDVSVQATPKGVEISVTEGLDFGMFEIGSAVPEKALVAAMDKIGAVLKERGGTLVIKGHTDARSFHGKGYDNWRLSTARAHATYHMLLRAGLDEKRVAAISGVADREPKLPEKPLDAANRRIEILLELPE